MDFLDPKKQRAHTIRLLAGYVLLGVAVLIATLILLYQAWGFGLDKSGDVIQRGLVFVSSQPSNAAITLNGKLSKATTNNKLQLEAGMYDTKLSRAGYTDWRRQITVEGGSLQHFGYPRLFPNKLVSAPIKTYAAAPGLATSSPDRRWLLVQQESSLLEFDVYDLADPKKIAANVKPLALPEAVVSSPATGTHAWKLVEWSTDNRHVLLQHIYNTVLGGATIDTSEYIMVDRVNPESSVNISTTLGLAGAKQVSLRDKRYDRYYVYDSAALTLGLMSLSETTKVTPYIDHVLAYKTYAANMVLYVSDRDPQTTLPTAAGKVVSLLRDGDQTYKVREHSAAPPYLVEMAQYDGDWLVAVGASGENKIYVYKNPQRIRKSSVTATLVPVQIMRIDGANHIQFSSNTQHIMAENATSFVDFDAEYGKGYKYTSAYPIDPPADKASWMGSSMLTYVSGGKVVVFDYDSLNPHALATSSAAYLPFFDRGYNYLYTLAPVAGQPAGSVTLQSTSLLTPEDQ